jgi:hypothetical protein
MEMTPPKITPFPDREGLGGGIHISALSALRFSAAGAKWGLQKVKGRGARPIID